MNKIAVRFINVENKERRALAEKTKELIFKLYPISNPLFIRTAEMEGAGDIYNEEIRNKNIYHLHWMQIFGREMLNSINVKKLNKSDKFYEVTGLPDGAVYIRITEDFGYTPQLIKELADEIDIDCPEIYRWWE